MLLILIAFLFSPFSFSLQSLKDRFYNDEKWQKEYQAFLNSKTLEEAKSYKEIDEKFLIEIVGVYFDGPETWQTFKAGLRHFRSNKPEGINYKLANLHIKRILEGQSSKKNLPSLVKTLKISEWLKIKVLDHISHLAKKNKLRKEERDKRRKLCLYKGEEFWYEFDGERHILKSTKSSFKSTTPDDVWHLHKKNITFISKDKESFDKPKKRVKYTFSLPMPNGNNDPIIIDDDEKITNKVTNVIIDLEQEKSNEVRLNYILPKISIANKYIPNHQKLLPFLYIEGNKNFLPLNMANKIEFFPHSKKQNEFFLHEQKIKTENISATYYTTSLQNAFLSNNPLIFIMAKRETPSIPKNLHSQRVILVKSKKEVENSNINEWLQQNVDLLVIDGLKIDGSYINENDLGLLTARRWAALFCAALYQKKLVLIDDNVAMVQTSNFGVTSFDELISTLEILSKENNLSLISLLSFKHYRRGEEIPNEDFIKDEFIKEDELGSKFFFIDLPFILKTDPQLLYQLLPSKLDIWGEDIFLQYSIYISNLKIARINYDEINIVRQPYINKNFSNTCTSMKATAWLDIDIETHWPELKKKVVQGLKDLVSSFLSTINKTNERIRSTDLGEWTSENFYEGPEIYILPGESEKSLKEVGEEIKAFIESEQKQGSFLRPYQLDALLKIGESLNENLKGYLSLPTGAGKTFLMHGLLAFLIKSLEHNQKNVVISFPTQDLVEQFYESLSKWNGLSNKPIDPKKVILAHAKKVKKIHLENNELLKNGGYVIAACQNTLAKWILEDKNHLNLIGFFLVDEAHRMSNKLIKVINNYKGLNQSPMLGFTATPSDVTKSLFDQNPIFEISTEKLVEDSYLAPWLLGYIPNNYLKNDEYDEELLVKYLNDSEKYVPKFDPYARSFSKMKGLLYVPSIDEAKSLANTLKGSKFKARAIHSELDDKDKKEILEKFFYRMDKEDRIDLLIVVDMFRLGFDAPIDYVIVAKNIADRDALIQMRGRALRLSSLSVPENKEKVAHFVVLQNIYKDEKLKTALRFRGQMELLKKIMEKN